MGFGAPSLSDPLAARREKRREAGAPNREIRQTRPHRAAVIGPRCYVAFQIAATAIPRRLFANLWRPIAVLRPPRPVDGSAIPAHSFKPGEERIAAKPALALSSLAAPRAFGSDASSRHMDHIPLPNGWGEGNFALDFAFIVRRSVQSLASCGRNDLKIEEQRPRSWGNAAHERSRTPGHPLRAER